MPISAKAQLTIPKLTKWVHQGCRDGSVMPAIACSLPPVSVVPGSATLPILVCLPRPKGPGAARVRVHRDEEQLAGLHIMQRGCDMQQFASLLLPLNA
jgi:hypothetical protein